MKDLFNTRNSNYQLRGSNILSLPSLKTTSYHIHPLGILGHKIRNFLDDNLRTQSDLQSFKEVVRLVDFENIYMYLVHLRF